MEFRWRVKERARTYISRMPESVQGQGGSQAMFNVAAVLMRGFSLEEADGMELLAEWNEHHAHPRWSPVELRHKLRDGAKAERAEGYLLERERYHATSHQTSTAAKELPKERRLQSLTSLHTPEALAATGASHPPNDQRQLKQPLLGEGAEPQSADKNTPPDSHVHDGTRLVPLPAKELALPMKEPRTPTWPAFSPLTDEDRDRIAILRKVPGAAVEIMRRAGFLGKAQYEGHDCFIMGEGRFAQARRFDGGLLPVQGGRRQSKAKNLPGSEGAFMGRKWALGSRCPVLLVEGVIGLVEAIAALMMAHDCLDWTCLAAVSASSRFVRDPELRDALAGRKVHIIPDAGIVGRDAAGAWLAELEKAGAHVHLEPEPLPVACKDLGDVVARVYQGALPSDDIHHHATLHRAADDLREYLHTIFS